VVVSATIRQLNIIGRFLDVCRISKLYSAMKYSIFSPFFKLSGLELDDITGLCGVSRISLLNKIFCCMVGFASSELRAVFQCFDMFSTSLSRVSDRAFHVQYTKSKSCKHGHRES
jgi:hypothetical protein